MKLKFRMTNGEWRRQKHSPEKCIRHSPFVIRNFSAFTLIEIMLAVLIFCLSLAMIYSTWLMIMRSTVVGQKAAAHAQRQRVAIQTIEEAITSIESFQASLQYYSFIVQNNPNGGQALLSFVARLPDDFPRSGRYGESYPVRRLTFDVEAVTDPVTRKTENDLVLRQYVPLFGEDVDEEQNPFVLARNVQLFGVECWDTNTPGWVEEWDDTNAIPPVIRISLAFGGKNDNSADSEPVFAVTRDIAVPTEMMPVSAQVPGANPAMFGNSAGGGGISGSTGEGGIGSGNDGGNRGNNGAGGTSTGTGGFFGPGGRQQ